MRLIHLLFAATLSATAAEAGESVYTERNLDACRTLARTDEGPSVTLECAGYKGLKVYFKEGDLRQGQTYGPISKAWLDEAFESFGPFNHTNATIEWRLDGGAPYATILRWFVSDPETTSDTDTRYGQVLVVSTVATKENPTSCVVGYIDALENKDANSLARAMADAAAKEFTCGKDEPQWQGKRGKLAGEPMRYLPEKTE